MGTITTEKLAKIVAKEMGILDLNIDKGTIKDLKITEIKDRIQNPQHNEYGMIRFVYIKKWNKILSVKPLNINTNGKIAVELWTPEDEEKATTSKGHTDILLVDIDKISLNAESLKTK